MKGIDFQWIFYSLYTKGEKNYETGKHQKRKFYWNEHGKKNKRGSQQCNKKIFSYDCIAENLGYRAVTR